MGPWLVIESTAVFSSDWLNAQVDMDLCWAQSQIIIFLLHMLIYYNNKIRYVNFVLVVAYSIKMEGRR